MSVGSDYVRMRHDNIATLFFSSPDCLEVRKDARIARGCGNTQWLPWPGRVRSLEGMKTTCLAELVCNRSRSRAWG